MKKTKYLLVVFAIFAAFLLFTASCIARTVYEKNSIDASEQIIQNKIDDICNSANELINDGDVLAAIEQIYQAETEEEILIGYDILENTLS